jgi:4-hydroxy-4-methyl-2-oxoglutarate aldolase
VHPGDLVIGDLDGVVVIAREQCAEVLRTARAREDREAEIMKKLATGATTLELLKFDEAIRSLGVKEEPV